jgi:hypothetical protein
MPGIRGFIGHHPVMPNPQREYSQSEESQFRQHLTFQLQAIGSQIDNVAQMKTRNSSTSAYRLMFMLRRSK